MNPNAFEAALKSHGMTDDQLVKMNATQISLGKFLKLAFDIFTKNYAAIPGDIADLFK